MAKFEITKSEVNNEYHFTLKANNHKVILVGESYETLEGLKKGISSVKRNAKKRNRFIEKLSEDDRDYFVLKATNGEPIGVSQMYKSENGMYKGIDSVMAHAPKAKIVYANFDPTEDEIENEGVSEGVSEGVNEGLKSEIDEVHEVMDEIIAECENPTEEIPTETPIVETIEVRRGKIQSDRPSTLKRICNGIRRIFK